MPQKRERTESITVKFPVTLAEKLKKLAVKKHQPVSQVLRGFAEKGLNVDSYADQVDPIRNIIRQEVNDAVKQQTNRLAALLNRMTIIAAAGYYATVATIAGLIDGDLYSSFEKIEQLARRRALTFANSKRDDGVAAFMDDEQMNQAIRQIRGKRKRSQNMGATYDDMLQGDFDFNNYDSDDDDN